MIRRLALILALVLLWSGADAKLLTGAGTTSSGTDNIAALRATMAHGQWVQIAGSISNDILARTRANFDGGSTWLCCGDNGVAASPNASPMGVGGAGNGQGLNAFSREWCDINRSPPYCFMWGGGHRDGGDGSAYGLDVNAAAGAVLASGLGHHVVLQPSCQYIPATLPVPASNPQTPGFALTTTTTAASTSTVITVASSTNSANGMWVGDSTGAGTAIPFYTRISSGGGTTTLTLDHTVNIGNGATVNITDNDLCAPNVNGNYAPISTHAYNCTKILQASNTVLHGGAFNFGYNGWDTFENSASTFDLGTKLWTAASVVNGGCNQPSGGNGFEDVEPDYHDGNWYAILWNSGTGGGLYRLPNSATTMFSGASQISPGFGGSTLCEDDGSTVTVITPGASGFSSFFCFADKGLTGTDFLYVDGIESGGTINCSPVNRCNGSFSNNPLQGSAPTDALTSDGTHAVIWEGTYQLYDVTFTPGSPVTASITAESTSPTGAPNDLNNSGQCLTIFDLGTKYGHMKLALDCGNGAWLENP